MHKRLFQIVILCIVAVAVMGLSANAQKVEDLKFPKLNKLNLPDVEKVTLDNGLRLYILEDHSLPLFEVRVRISIGSYLEPAEKIGLADITAAVMRTGGTAKYNGDEIDEMLEGIGGAVETGMDLITASAGVNVMSDHTDLALDVLAEVLRRPAFSEDKIELAKVQTRSGISRRNDDIGGIALREYRKLIFGAESPYARHAEYATIDAITRDDLVQFHQTYYEPQNIQMALIGDFSRKEITEKIITLFSDWAKGDQPVPPPPEVNYEWRNKLYYVEKADASQSYIRVGHMGGFVTDPDHPERLVMGSIFGGGFGSRLTNTVRVKHGLAYSAGGRFNAFLGRPGYLFSVASTSPENTIQCAQLMVDVVKSMTTDLPNEQEMQKGRDGYLNSFVFNFDSKNEIVSRMMGYDYYGLPEDFLSQVKERVENVTPEDVLATAQNNLHPDQLVVLVVGNAAEFGESLETLGFGPPEEIDITIPSGEKKMELVINDETLAAGKALLQKGAETLGGTEGFKSVVSTMSKATVTLVTPGGEMALPVESIRVLPDQSRSVASFMGQQMLNITDGDKGWKPDQTGALIEKTAEELADEVKDNARDLLFVFRDCGNADYRAVTAGEGEVDGKAVSYVAILDENDESICQFGFSPEANQLVCCKYWGSSMLGEEGNIEETYGEFKDVGGITLPMSRVRTLDGRIVDKRTYSEYVINGEVPADSFVKP